MVITKHRDKVLALRAARETANKGCNVCPCCGENRMDGCIDHTFKTWKRWSWLLQTKNMKADCYHCLSCGAEWESDPYEYDPDDYSFFGVD